MRARCSSLFCQLPKYPPALAPITLADLPHFAVASVEPTPETDILTGHLSRRGAFCPSDSICLMFNDCHFPEVTLAFLDPRTGAALLALSASALADLPLTAFLLTPSTPWPLFH